MGASVTMLDRQDGVKSVLSSHLQLHAERRHVEENLPGRFQGLRGGARAGSEPPAPHLCGQDAQGTLHLWPSLESLWLGRGEGMGGRGAGGRGRRSYSTPSTGFLSFKKNKRQREKQHVSARQLWSLTILRKACSGDVQGLDTNQVPRELPFPCIQRAELGVTLGCSCISGMVPPHGVPVCKMDSAGAGRWGQKGL